MRKILLISMLASTSLLVSCGESTATNAGNSSARTANTANNSAAKPAAADTASAEADVRKMVTEFEAALNKNDADAAGRFYADDYMLIDQDGQMQTKAARLDQIRTGKVKWEGLKFSDLKIRMHPAGDGAAITARATGKATVDGKTTDRNSMVTWVVAKRPEGWRFVNAQITDIKGDAAASPGGKPATNAAPANR